MGTCVFFKFQINFGKFLTFSQTERKFPYAVSNRKYFLTHTPNTRIKYFLAALKLTFDANINIRSPHLEKAHQFGMMSPNPA